MKSLFNMKVPAGSPVMYAANWNYVKAGLTQNLGRVIQFYRRNPMAVQSDHFLVRLLQSITIDPIMSLERYYANVDSLSLNLSMVLKMTSNIYKGSVFDGTFYGPNSKEILVADDEGFDPVLANKNWKNLSAVKVLSHPYSDLNLNLPNGTKKSNEQGISVLSINIALLAIQYRAFKLAEAEIVEEGGARRTIMQFIHMYVLPNMLASHLDFAILNRMYNIITYQDNAAWNNKHSFHLTDFSNKLDSVQKTTIDNLDKSKRTFVGAMRTIPVIVKPNMEEAMLLPNIASGRQVQWALIVSRLVPIKLLIEVAQGQFATKNSSETNMMLRTFERMKNDGTMRDALPNFLYYDVQYDINWIVTSLGGKT
jgi:hypothetical protein